MGVPQDIRAVPRPRNTVVVDTGSKGRLRYAVRERTSPVRTSRGLQPRNGKIIGHIVDGSYIPAQAKKAAPCLLNLGCSWLVADLAQDVRKELASHWGQTDADLVLALASLGIMQPHLGFDLMDMHDALYRLSLASLVFPGLDLSPEHIHALLARLGKDTGRLFCAGHNQKEGQGPEENVSLPPFLLRIPVCAASTLAQTGGNPREDGGRTLFLKLAPRTKSFAVLAGYLEETDALDRSSSSDRLLDMLCGTTFFSAREEASIDAAKSLQGLVAQECFSHALLPVSGEDKLVKKLSRDEFELLEDMDMSGKKRRSPDGDHVYAFRCTGGQATQEQGRKKKKGKKSAQGSDDVQAFRSDLDLPLPLVASLIREEKLWQRILAHLQPLVASCATLEAGERQGAGLVCLVAALVLRKMVQRAEETHLLARMRPGRILALLATFFCHAQATSQGRYACEQFRPPLSPESSEVLQALGLACPSPAKQADSGG